MARSPASPYSSSYSSPEVTRSCGGVRGRRRCIISPDTSSPDSSFRGTAYASSPPAVQLVPATPTIAQTCGSPESRDSSPIMMFRRYSTAKPSLRCILSPSPSAISPAARCTGADRFTPDIQAGSTTPTHPNAALHTPRAPAPLSSACSSPGSHASSTMFTCTRPTTGRTRRGCLVSPESTTDDSPDRAIASPGQHLPSKQDMRPILGAAQHPLRLDGESQQVPAQAQDLPAASTGSCPPINAPQDASTTLVTDLMARLDLAAPRIPAPAPPRTRTPAPATLPASPPRPVICIESPAAPTPPTAAWPASPAGSIIHIDSGSDADSDAENVPLPPVDTSRKGPLRAKAPASGAKASARAFARQREQVARQLYADWNLRIFGGMLNPELPIVWNPRLIYTAGQCVDDGSKNHLKASKKEKISTKIELSSKVIDSSERLQQTLAHEMCHVAAWEVERDYSQPHGSGFKRWAQLFMAAVPSLEITRCHNYTTFMPFRWQCSNHTCKAIYSRCSKSIDVSMQVCSKCHGRLQFMGKFNRDGQPVQERSISEYSAFVKRTFSEVKGTLPPGTPSSVVFKAVSARWQHAKQQSATAASRTATDAAEKGVAAKEQLPSPLTPTRKQLFV